jgi:hypothetical protein
VERLQDAAGLGATFVVYRHLAEAYTALGEADLSLRARSVYDRIARENLRRLSEAAGRAGSPSLS